LQSRRTVLSRELGEFTRIFNEFAQLVAITPQKPSTRRRLAAGVVKTQIVTLVIRRQSAISLPRISLMGADFWSNL
jgi:hypothetical protein